MKIPAWVNSAWQHNVFVWGPVIIIVSALTAAFWNYTQDDVYITYTYSRHITEGQGFVFNPGEHVQGTTTPLFTLIMAGAYRITSDLLHAGNVISAFFLLVTTGLALRLMSRVVSRAANIAIAFLFVTSPLVYVSYGMETLLHCALLMLALALWAHDHRMWAMVTAALLTWNRADGVVLAGTFSLLATYDWWQTRQAHQKCVQYAFPAKLFAAYGVGIAPWFIFAWLYFGTPLPQTFSAKEEMLQGTIFLEDSIKWWKAFYANNPIILAALPLVPIGLGRALQQRSIRPIAVWTLLYILGYTVLNVSAFWYYTPVFLTLVLLAVVGGDYLVNAWLPSAARQPALSVAGILLVVIAGSGIAKAWDYHAPPPRMATYKLAGEWLNQHTDTNISLLIKDLGIVGYYAQRYTLDSFGLIVPDMHYTQDKYAVLKYKTDWVLTTQYWEMQRLAHEDWFQYHYVPVAQFSTSGDTEFAPMTAYQRVLSLEPPSQIVQGFDLPLTCVVNVEAGADLPVTTSARLFAEAGQQVSEAQHSFLWGQYPVLKTAYREVLIEQIALPVDVPPGNYRWQLMCDTEYAGQVEVLPIERAPDYTPLDLQPEWGDFAQLVGFALPRGDETWSGGMVELVLHWQAIGAASQDYSLFAHLVDANGVVRAQADGYPRNGNSPVSAWRAGATIVDIRKILLPPDLPAGDYTLLIGWYDWQSLKRVISSTGQDTITLPVTIRNRWPGGSGLP
jgi:arabinofuranosyltransferase